MMVKCSHLLYIVTLSGFVHRVLPCVATGGSGVVVTTTTASSVTTTTTAATGCNSCTASQVTFAQAAGTIQIDSMGILGTADGCLTLTATCTAQLNYYAFMEFNFNQGGPAENANMGRTINALLNCVDGNWVYTSLGVSRIITQVSCNEAPDAG